MSTQPGFLEYGLYQLVIYENTKSEHVAFCTPESAAMIDSYLEYRKRCGEVLDPESPLIREDFDMDDPFRINKPQHIKVGSIKSTLQIHAVKAGLREVEASENNKRTRKKVPLCNGFRRFADTMMLNSKMNPVIKDMLIDHDVGLEKNYYRPTLNDLLQGYLKAVDMLTIEESHRLTRKVSVLISPSLHTGLDLKDDQSRFQIVVKIPYPSRADRWIETKRKIDGGRWYNWQTALRLVQSCGRSIRSKDDWAKTYVLDWAFSRFIRDNKLPVWFRECII